MNSTQKLFNSLGVTIDNFKDTKSPFYFLSHFHSDHYEGISLKLFQNTNKLIYCSELTGNLLYKAFKIPKKSIQTLTLGVKHQISLQNKKIFVTLFNANHCSGSVMFLFENIETREKILYTGDFRFEDYVLTEFMDEEIINEIKNVEKIYIDTTFCDSFYEYLPSRNETINVICNLIDKHQGKVYILTEVLGSECIILALYHKYHQKFYIDPKLKNRRIEEIYMLIKDCITTDPKSTRFIVTDKKGIDDTYNKEENLLIRPTTMWTKEEYEKSMGLEKKEICKKKGNVYYVIFSMHSSLSELKTFISLVQPKEIFSIRNTNINLSILREKKRKSEYQISSSFEESPKYKEMNDFFPKKLKENLKESLENDQETESLFQSII